MASKSSGTYQHGHHSINLSALVLLQASYVTRYHIWAPNTCTPLRYNYVIYGQTIQRTTTQLPNNYYDYDDNFA